MAVYYKRSTNIYISKAPDASANATNTVQLNVKDFSYNQSSSPTQVGRETLDPTQARTLAPHVAVISPVNFTFTTYVEPLVDTNVTSPEEYLWISLMGTDTISSSPTSSTIDFSDGNVAELQNLTLWFDQPTKSKGNYRLNNAVIDSVTIDLNINQLTELQWSGRALSITEDNTPPASTDRTGLQPCMRNKLTTIDLNMNSVDYTLALTGGRVTIDNNNQFYGRVKLGQTTTPVGSYTGNRRIFGNFSFYMKDGTNESVDLFNELLTNAANNNYEATHLAQIDLVIGGSTNPNLTMTIPQAVLDLANQDFGGIISATVPFTVKEETSNYTTITYNI